MTEQTDMLHRRNLNLPVSTWKRLDEIAKHLHTSTSVFIRQEIERALSLFEKEISYHGKDLTEDNK